MPDPRADIVRIIGHHGRVWQDGDLTDDVALGRGGLGLDSIALVELLFACERHFGFAFPATLLDGGPLTIGRLAGHARAQSGPGGHEPRG